MNHFELFQLPEALDIDLAALKKQFLNLQQQYHPDKAQQQAEPQALPAGFADFAVLARPPQLRNRGIERRHHSQ